MVSDGDLLTSGHHTAGVEKHMISDVDPADTPNSHATILREHKQISSDVQIAGGHERSTDDNSVRPDVRVPQVPSCTSVR